MYKKISVLVPTRKRVERLKTLLASYDETYDAALSEMVFRVDDDDDETQEFLAWHDHRRVVGPRMSGYASLPEFFNELLRYADGDVLMCGNDDMVFKTRGWAASILAAANRYPDGLFNFGVATHNEGHYPFSIVSRRAAEQMGFLWDPRIFWGDIFLRDVMQSFGRCEMLHDVQIDHDWAGHAPDATFVDGNMERFLPRGDSYWSNVHSRAVDEAVEKLRPLRTW